MYLKRLSLLGFKTFAGKTTFEFKPGITAIVGPNGCGKSNLFDAIVWVMGEQSMRSLRGRKMEEVVFHGTEKLKPLGYAQVELTFDNEDNFFPLPHSEVSIIRRYYRSGESEFLINNEPCRLRDIQGLLLDTGLGKFSYSIISQGDVEYIINLSPMERRTIFDEAAGINKYRVEKRKTLQKITDTDTNIARLTDIVAEIEERLGPLAAQAEKARRHEEISDEIEALKLNIIMADIARQRALLKQFDDEEATAKQGLDAVRDSVSAGKDERAAAQNDTLAAQQELEALQGERGTLANSAGRTEEMLKYASRNVENIRRRIQSESERTAAERERVSQISQSIAALEKELGEIEADVALRDSDIDKRQSEFEARKSDAPDSVRKERDALRTETQKLRAAEKEHDSARAAALADLNFAERSEAERRERVERLRLALETLNAEKEEFLPELRGLKEKTAASEKELARLDDERRDENAAAQELRETVSVSGQTLAKLTAKTEVLHERIADLKQAISPDAPAESWLRRKTGDSLPRLCDLIEIAEGRENLVRAALGSLLEAPVLIEPESVEQVVIVPDRELAILAPGACASPSDDEMAALRGRDGVAGFLSDFARLAPDAPHAVDSFLRRALIVNSPGDAVAALLAAADGFLIRSGDGAAAIGNGVLILGGRHATLETLTKESEKASEEIAAARTELEEKQNRLAEHEARASALRKLYDECYRDFRELQGGQKELEARDQRLSGRRESISHDIEIIEKELASFAERKSTSAAALKKHEKELSAAREKAETAAVRLQVIEATLSGDTSVTAQHQAFMLDLRGQLRERRNAAAAAKSGMEFHRNEIRRIEDSVARFDSEIGALNSEREATEKEMASAAAELDETKRRLAEHEAGITAARERLAAIRTNAAQLEQKIESLREEEERIRQSLNQIEMKRARAEATLAESVRLFEEEYPHITEEEALGRASDVKHGDRTRYRELKAEREALQPVNQLAIDEYDEAANRKEFLSSQLEDMTATRKELLDMIDHFDRLCRDSFVDTYNAIREKFSETFLEIFNGGEAVINLTNPEDPLESGVEIAVQIPGKRMRSLQLLSGGEKALCALSFIFSILKVKPSPFYLLDEVDAGLDDQNVIKFKDLLAKYSSEAQFFIITHNKGSLEGADHLYGITMEVEGITKALSVTLD